VPFGGLENDGRIRWPDSALEMNVFGFSDALLNAIQLDLAPDVQLPVATIPLLVALKFFAFADRKNETDRDLTDLWHVMQRYVLDGREGELFEEPLSVIIDEHFDWEYARPLLLGYDVGRACRPAMVERLLPILGELIDPYSGNIHQLISGYSSAEQEEAERQRVSTSFLWLMKGLQLG
jgi:predicted nucleotidyltransferase